MIIIKINYASTLPNVSITYDQTNVYAKVVYGTGSSSGATNWGDIDGTLSDQTDLQNALNAKQNSLTLTTSGTSGASTLIGSTLNIPNYQVSGFVPYTGATGNVNLGEYEMKAGQLTLDTSPTGTASVGTTRWNDTLGSNETTLKGGNVILKNGVDLVARIVNKVSPNTTLTKAAYQAVRVSGAQGQRLAVALAQANNDNNSADTIGLVTETIATNQEGFIITVGQLEGINTTGSLQGESWSDGDVIYLSPTTAGALTNVKPVAPQHIIIIGYIEYAHQNNGKIYVKVMNGWELGELHDVTTAGATNGQVLGYNSTTAIWQPTNKQNTITLTTTGSSGASTFVSDTLNVPTYTLAGLGGVSSNLYTADGSLGSARTITLNSNNLSIAGSSFTSRFTSAGRLLLGTTTEGTNILDVVGDVAISGVLRDTVTTNRQTASYTLVLADSNKLVEMNVASANNLTVPLNSSVAFPIGTQIDIIQYGAGQTSIVATGGVTIRSTNSWLKINARYGAVTLIKIGADEWYLVGNLNA